MSTYCYEVHISFIKTSVYIQIVSSITQAQNMLHFCVRKLNTITLPEYQFVLFLSLYTNSLYWISISAPAGA